MDHGQESRALAALACLARRELDRTPLQANGDRIVSTRYVIPLPSLRRRPKSRFTGIRKLPHLDDLFSYYVVTLLRDHRFLLRDRRDFADLRRKAIHYRTEIVQIAQTQRARALR